MATLFSALLDTVFIFLYAVFNTVLAMALLLYMDIPYQYVLLISSIVSIALANITYEAMNPRKKYNLHYNEHHIHLPKTEEVKIEWKTEVKIEVPETSDKAEEINPRTKKPYKMSLARREALRAQALKREQDKRIATTKSKSVARKTVKSKKSV